MIRNAHAVISDSQVSLEECDHSISQRRNVGIDEDRVYDLFRLLITPFHYHILDMVSPHVPVNMIARRRTLVLRKSHRYTEPSSHPLAK